MARAAQILGLTTLVACAASVWLYVDNRALRAQLDAKPARTVATSTTGSASAAAASDGDDDPWNGAPHIVPGAKWNGTTPPPQLPEKAVDSFLERRLRRQQEMMAKFGRLENESDDDYRARVQPLITASLLIPRAQVDTMRKEVEAKAGVTPEQSKKLDAAFGKVYDQALDYTNKAIAEGTLSPYERNVSSWLEFAGGLGGILNDANSQIGQILSPAQMKAIGSSGFDWGEYLGASAPWEKLNPPPPPK
jgi:hypothetical protein